MSRERHSARNHFIKHSTTTPDVCSRIHLKTAGLFRRHVAYSSQDHAWVCLEMWLCRRLWVTSFLRSYSFCQLRETEIQDFYVSVGADHDVFRLNIPMNNTCCMRYHKRRAKLNGNINL